MASNSSKQSQKQLFVADTKAKPIFGIQEGEAARTKQHAQQKAIYCMCAQDCKARHAATGMNSEE